MKIRHKVGTIAGSMAVLLAAIPGISDSAANASTESFNQKTAAYIETFIGRVRYEYGGSSPRTGFDCSGLVAYAASRAGIYLPRTAQQQQHAGVPVRRSELRAGDLVFMHLQGKELHVGIAVDAQRFVHAPASGGHVRIDSLDRVPYSSGFLGARRIVDARAPP